MKKILILLVFAVCSVFVQAQIVNSFVSFANDTTTNAETVYMVITTPVAINGNYTGAIEIGGTNSSGTATVTATIQVSDDNTTWYDSGTATTINNAGTVTNYAWTLQETAFKYYRIKLISTGTGVTHFTGKLGLKRR